MKEPGGGTVPSLSPIPRAPESDRRAAEAMEHGLEVNRPTAIAALLGGAALLRVGAAGAGIAVQFDLRDMAASGYVIGFVGAAQAVSEMLAAPFLARAADRFGRNRVLVAGPLISAVAALSLAFMSHPLGLAGARLVEGIGAGAFVPTALGSIAAATSHSRNVRATASGAFEGATLAGYGAGFLLGGLAYDTFHRGAFLLLAITYLLAGLICARFVPTIPPLPVSSLKRVFGAVTGRGPIRSFLPAWFCVWALLGAFGGNLSALISRSSHRHTRVLPLDPMQFLVHRFDQRLVGLIALVWIILLLAGIAAWTSWIPRLGAARMMRLCVPGAWVMCAGLAIINHGPMRVELLALALVAGGIVWMAGFGPAALNYLAECSETFAADRSVLMAFYTVTLAAGGAAGSLLGGIAVQWGKADGLIVLGFLLMVAAYVALRPVLRYERALLEGAP